MVINSDSLLDFYLELRFSTSTILEFDKFIKEIWYGYGLILESAKESNIKNRNIIEMTIHFV